MKKILTILLTCFILISCGPHRMRCDARGICKAKPELTKPKICHKTNNQA